MNPDEYMEQLKKGLVNPEPYKIRGTYNYFGRKNHQMGKVLIDENMQIVGEIHDPNSVCPKHIVKGSISAADNSMSMNFEKIPTTGMGCLATIYYHLAKADDGDVLGIYDGMWTFNEAVIIPKNLLISARPGNVTVATEMIIPDQKNIANLQIYK
jgi:hypothetical protein